jgi:hypothetical protein
MRFSYTPILLVLDNKVLEFTCKAVGESLAYDPSFSWPGGLDAGGWGERVANGNNTEDVFPDRVRILGHGRAVGGVHRVGVFLHEQFPGGNPSDFQLYYLEPHLVLHARYYLLPGLRPGFGLIPLR